MAKMMGLVGTVGGSVAFGGPTMPRGASSTLLNGLTHYWLLNEETGNRADSVGGATAVDTNNTAFTATTPWGGKAAVFATASDRMLKATAPGYTLNLPPSGEKRTFNFWMRSADVLSSDKHATGQWTASSTEQSWSLNVAASGVYTLKCVFGALREVDTATTGLDNNTWHMVTIVFDGTARTGTLFLDGELTGVSTAAGTGAGDNGLTLTIGCLEQYYTTLSLDGAVGLYGVWGRELTEAERLALFNGGNGFPYPFIS